MVADIRGELAKERATRPHARTLAAGDLNASAGCRTEGSGDSVGPSKERSEPLDHRAAAEGLDVIGTKENENTRIEKTLALSRTVTTLSYLKIHLGRYLLDCLQRQKHQVTHSPKY